MSGPRFKAKEEHRREIAEKVQAATVGGEKSLAYSAALEDPECVHLIRHEADYYLDIIVNPTREDHPLVFLLAFAEHVELWKPLYQQEISRFHDALRPKKWMKNHSEATLENGTRLADLPWWPHK